MNLLIQSAVSGILVGGLYAMMSLGLSLSWGVLKIINLAHFSFILLSGYVTYEVAASYGLDPFVGIVVAVPLFFLVGTALQWLFERFRISEFESLLLTFGLFIIFESLARSTWSADFRRLTTEENPYSAASVWLGSIALPIPQLSAFIAAILISVGTMFLLERSFFGKAVRALAQDRHMAAAFGIDHQRVAVILSGLAASYAALAGVFIAMSRALTPGMGVEWFGIVFPVVILGGLGSAMGALTAGLVIGVVAALATVAAGPSMAPLVTFLILIAALLFRPQGLLRSGTTG